MKAVVYYYSATGNTKRLLAKVVEGLGDCEVTMCNMLEHVTGANGKNIPDPKDFDFCGFAFPVMIFRPPYVARKFLDLLQRQENPRKAFIFFTHAGMGANSDKVYKNLLVQKNFEVFFAKDIVCEDSYIPFRKFMRWIERKGKPDTSDFEKATSLGRELLEKLGEEFRPKGSMLGNFFESIGKNAPENAGESFLGKRWLDETACTACGLCARICPTVAIKMAEKLPVCDVSACLGCCACFNKCPVNAWRLRRFELKYHYRPKIQPE